MYLSTHIISPVGRMPVLSYSLPVRASSHQLCNTNDLRSNTGLAPGEGHSWASHLALLSFGAAPAKWGADAFYRELG